MGSVLIQITALLNLSILRKVTCLGLHPKMYLEMRSLLWFKSGVAFTWSPAYGTFEGFMKQGLAGGVSN